LPAPPYAIRPRCPPADRAPYSVLKTSPVSSFG